MSNFEETTTRACSVLVGSLLVGLSSWDLIAVRSVEDSNLPRMILAYICVWIGSLLLKRSFDTIRAYPTTPAAPIIARTISSRSESCWRRRQPSSSCPKPFTPTAPIRVVSVRSKKSCAPRRRVPTSALLIPPELDVIDDSPSDISSYNNESFITGSTECSTSCSPKSVEALSSPAHQSLRIPDSIAAIWEPVEPTSSKLW